MNFGHTVGHAVEAISDFKIKHGEALAIGMVAAAKISQHFSGLHDEEVASLTELIRAAGLPVDLPELDDTAKEKLLELIKHDKKVRDDKIRFVLLKTIGNAFISDKIDTGRIGEVLFGWQPT
jgi:3-dehydroquinate synthase